MSKPAPEIVETLAAIVGAGNMLTGEDLASYEQDWRGRARGRALCVVRPGTADEVAQGILFVIQNDFVTGTTVDVDGGWLLS